MLSSTRSAATVTDRAHRRRAANPSPSRDAGRPERPGEGRHRSACGAARGRPAGETRFWARRGLAKKTRSSVPRPTRTAALQILLEPVLGVGVVVVARDLREALAAI